MRNEEILITNTETKTSVSLYSDCVSRFNRQVKMKPVIVALVLIFWVKVLLTADVDSGNACIIEYLKHKGKLGSDFPAPNRTLSGCDFAMRITVSATRKYVASMLAEKPSIVADCVTTQLEKADFVDYLLKEQIIESSRHLPFEQIVSNRNEVKTTIKGILAHAASTCNSDATYAGLYDKYLNNRNRTESDFQENYCFAKYANDTNTIQIRNVNINPENIDVSLLDCNPVIEKERERIERKLNKNFKERKLSQAIIDCVMKSIKSGNMFEKIIALNVLNNLKLSLDVKRNNTERISKDIKEISMNILRCVMG